MLPQNRYNCDGAEVTVSRRDVTMPESTLVTLEADVVVVGMYAAVFE